MRTANTKRYIALGLRNIKSEVTWFAILRLLSLPSMAKKTTVVYIATTLVASAALKHLRRRARLYYFGQSKEVVYH